MVAAGAESTARMGTSPHRRLNPLTGEWVLVSPQRLDRPWLGHVDRPNAAARAAFDPTCYLCPGNARAGAQRNPAYTGTFVFTNDFPALLPGSERGSSTGHALLRFQDQPGTCRVVCFSPRHDLTLAEMASEDIAAVINTWVEQTEELGRTYAWVQVFENKGEQMGASNPHPHGQIWASAELPTIPALEARHQAEYLAAHGSSLLVDYAAEEVRRAERVVAASDAWLAVVPYWAVWPFEVLLMPRRSVGRLPDLTPSERADLAGVLRQLLVRYDNLFEVACPYSMGWHGAPLRPRVGRVAAARALLPAPAALGRGAQVSGRIRNAGRTPTRPHSRAGGGNAPDASRRPVRPSGPNHPVNCAQADGLVPRRRLGRSAG